MHSTSSSTTTTGHRHRALLVVMALVAATFTTAIGGGVAGAVGAITVTPSTGLVDGQVVHVAATGLDSNRGWLMEQCVANHMIEGCDSSTLTSGGTDFHGDFSIDVAVQTILHTPMGTIDCRTNADPCVFGATTSGGPDGAVAATLAFDPDGPLLPPGIVHATPDTGLIDRQQVAVDGTGFRPSDGYLEIRECVGGATEITDCRSSSYSGYFPVEPDGAFHGSINVRTFLLTDAGATIDCRTAVHACELRVGRFYEELDPSTATISFDPDAPAADPPTIAADPDTDLIDGQTVAVTASGFTADAPVSVAQCAFSDTLGTCEYGSYGFTDADGGLSLNLHVRTRLYAGEILDCRDVGVDCSIQAFSYEDGDRAVTPLGFDPDGPLLPPPTLVATPSTDLVDGQVVTLSGSGYLTPDGPIITSPVTDDRHPDAKWVAPSSAPDGWRAPRSSANRSVPQAPTTHDEPNTYYETIVQCVTAPTFDLINCNPETWGSAEVDSAGDLSGTMQVWSVFTTFGGTTVDCRTAPGACSLYTYDYDPLVAASTVLDFDPNAPLAPPPTITVTPTTGLSDQQEMHVVGDGFPANTVVSLHQCRSGQSGLDGCDTDFFATVLTDEFGHIDLMTRAKEVLAQGSPFGNPYDTTFDCGSAPDACRLLLSDYRPVAAWPEVALSYGTAAAPPPAAGPSPQVETTAQFTG